MRAEEVEAESMTSPHASAQRQFKSLWTLGSLTPWQVGRNVFDQIVANHVFGRAAELAFYFLFALFPLILLMMTSFGLVAAYRLELQSHLLSYFEDFLPPAAFQLLRTVATELAAHASGRKLTFGIMTALWCISGGISSMISALNLAYHVRETRPWFKVQAISIGLSVLIPIVLFAGKLMMLIGSHFLDQARTDFQFPPLVIEAWKWLVAIFVVTVSCSLIYHYGPDLKERRRWSWFTPGLVIGAFVWLAASFGFRMYLHFFNNYSYSYGSLGAVMILMVWLYVAGLAYLIGGEINAEIERAAGRRASSATVRTPYHN